MLVICDMLKLLVQAYSLFLLTSKSCRRSSWQRSDSTFLDDEGLELKGKIQSSTAHVKKTMSHVVLEPVTIIAAVVASVIGLVSLKMFSKRPGSKHKKAA